MDKKLTEEEKQKKLEKLYKDFQEEQKRLHPEIYDKKKSGGN